jgi:hypothetical protein
MSKALNKRISKAFDAIYRKGDTGLDYMDRHCELDADLMQHFYDDTLETLSKAELKTLAEQLETVVADMSFDLV